VLRSIDVVGPSLVHPASRAQLGDQSDALDFGNVHPFTGATSPSSPAPRGRIRLISSGWTASVRKSPSGSTPEPGGIHFASASAMSGAYGGSTGAMRGSRTAPRPTRPRLELRAPGHGAARPARAAWTLRVLWELSEPAASFRELQARCDGMSSSVLAQRLGELREAGVVARGAGPGYALSDEGIRLLEALAPLDAWSRRWARRT
jgi:HxlR-like helix-turn-helix